MARYTIKLKCKRKQFGVISSTGAGLVNGIGSGVESVGDAASSSFGQTAGGVASAMKFGGTVGYMLGGGPLGMLAGYAGTYLAGRAAAKAAGSGLQSMGQSMQNVQG